MRTELTVFLKEKEREILAFIKEVKYKNISNQKTSTMR